MPAAVRFKAQAQGAPARVKWCRARRRYELVVSACSRAVNVHRRCRRAIVRAVGALAERRLKMLGPPPDYPLYGLRGGFRFSSRRAGAYLRYGPSGWSRTLMIFFIHASYVRIVIISPSCWPAPGHVQRKLLMGNEMGLRISTQSQPHLRRDETLTEIYLRRR